MSVLEVASRFQNHFMGIDEAVMINSMIFLKGPTRSILRLQRLPDGSFKALDTGEGK